MELGAIPSDLTPYVEAMIENHRAIADQMAALTEAQEIETQARSERMDPDLSGNDSDS